MIEMIKAFDTHALLFIQEHIRCAFLDPIMVAASRIGDKGIFWILLCVVLLLFGRTRKGGIYQGASLAAEYIICDLVIKKLVMRPRPYLDIENLSILVRLERSSGFPSGHTASSLACAFALTYVFGAKGAWAYIPAVLIALSRLYVGVHYPSDVLCGAVLGTVVALVICKLIDAIYKKVESAKKD